MSEAKPKKKKPTLRKPPKEPKKPKKAVLKKGDGPAGTPEASSGEAPSEKAASRPTVSDRAKASVVKGASAQADDQARPTSDSEAGAPAVVPNAPFLSGEGAYDEKEIARRDKEQAKQEKARAKEEKARAKEAKAQAKRERAQRRREQAARAASAEATSPDSALAGADRAAAADASASEGAGASRSTRRVVALTPKRIVTAIIAILLVAIVVVVGLFSWNRWLRYDDVADFQGLWNYTDGAVQVTIDGEEIRLTKDAAYSYEIDPKRKSITLSFGSLTGQGVYEFSEDRNVLVIVDGRTPDLASILGLVDIAQGAADGTVTRLVRAGDLPAEEPATPASTGDEAPISPDAEGEESAGAEEPPSQEGEGAQSQDAPQDVSPDDAGSTEKPVDSLGSDPGVDAGSNVVTPEDMGVSDAGAGDDSEAGA